MQGEFNLFNDQSFDGVVAPLMTSWGTLDKGIISGRVTRDRTYSKDDCRHWAPWWKKSNKDQKINLMERISQILKSHDLTSWDLIFHHQEKSKLQLSHLYGVKSSDDLQSILSSKINRKKVPAEVIQKIITEFKNEGFSCYPNL